MSKAEAIIRHYYVPQTFPCGPQSSCCGPVGQSEDELRQYKTKLETRLPGVQVERIDVSQKLNLFGTCRRRSWSTPSAGQPAPSSAGREK